MRYIKICIIFVAVFLLNVMIVSARPFDLGDLLKKETQDLNGITYKNIELVDSNNLPQKLFYADFLPGLSSKYKMVIHHIGDDEDDYIGSTVVDIANDYESKTGNKVMVAVNADFFMGDHTPCGYYIKDGVIINDAPNTWMHEFGFDNLGNAVVGNIEGFVYQINVYTDDGVKEFVVDKYNEVPEDGEIALMEPSKFTSMNEPNSAKYLIQFDDQEATEFSYPLDGIAYRLARGTVVSDKSLSLPTGHLGINIKGDNEISQFFFNHYQYGTRVEVLKVPTGDFNGMTWVVGGYRILMQNGILLPKGAPVEDQKAPRTSIGITTEGNYFVMVIDGRQPEYSKGITVAQQGQLAKDLGAYTALEIDGGGSSTFLLRIDDTLTVMNKPSDGHLRNVSNAVLIVEKDEDEIITTTSTEATTTTEEQTTTTEEQTTTTTEMTTTTEEQTTTTETTNNSNDEDNNGDFNVLYLIIPLVVLGGVSLTVGVIRHKRV